MPSAVFHHPAIAVDKTADIKVRLIISPADPSMIRDSDHHLIAFIPALLLNQDILPFLVVIVFIYGQIRKVELLGPPDIVALLQIVSIVDLVQLHCVIVHAVPLPPKIPVGDTCETIVELSGIGQLRLLLKVSSFLPF